MNDVCNTNKVQELNELVKSCIIEAFLQLLETKDFHKISITEITEKAGVARVSFYRNFNSKEDVLTKHIEKIFFKEDFTDTPITDKDSLEAICAQSFETALENKEFFTALNRNNLLYLIYDRLNFFTPIHILNLGKYSHDIQSSFFAGATYGVISYWIKSDFRQSANSLAKDFSDILYNYHKG